MQITKAVAGAIVAMSLFVTDARAAGPDDYLVVVYKVNPVTNGRTWRELARECMNNEACAEVVDAAGAYVGIPPGTIKSTMDTADALGLGVEQEVEGEIHRYKIDAPPGHFLCRAHLKMISIAPDRGNRQPDVGVSAGFPGASFSIQVPRRPDPARSWVEIAYTATYMRYGLVSDPDNQDPDYQKCYYHNGVGWKADCRGAGCKPWNHELDPR